MKLIETDVRGEWMTDDHRFVVRPVDEGTVAWIAGGRFMVDDTSQAVGALWYRARSLADARRWISAVYGDADTLGPARFTTSRKPHQ